MFRPLLLVLLASTSLHAAIELPREKEKWIGTTVDDFTITSNAGVREIAGVAQNLLRMRKAIGKITSLEVRNDVPTNVILFRNARSFAPYRDAVLQNDGTSFTGLYLSREDVNFILLQADSPSGIDRVVFHELTHAFMRNTMPGAPLWFHEGVAEYYSTFATRGTRVEIGRPIAEHVRWLREKKPMPLSELFAVDLGSPTYNERTRGGVFYAQSWALVHYFLAGNPERRQQLPKLLAQLMAGRPAADAVRAAFGIEVAQLEQELRHYIGQPAFTFTSYRLDELETSTVPEPQPIPYDDVLFRLGDLLARAGAHTTPDAHAHLSAALKRNPAHAGAWASLGVMHEAVGRRDEATRAFDEAVRLGTRDATAYLLYGASLLNRREAARARPLFTRAVELAPSLAHGWAGLGGTYVLAGDDDAAGIRALEKSLALAPGDRDAAFGLVQLYARAGRREEAQKLIDMILVPSGDTPMIQHARDTLALTEIARAMKLMDANRDDEALATLRATLASPTSPAIRREIEQYLASREATRLLNAQIRALNTAIALANSGKRTEAAAALDELIPEIKDDELRQWARDVRAKLPKRKGVK